MSKPNTIDGYNEQVTQGKLPLCRGTLEPPLVSLGLCSALWAIGLLEADQTPVAHSASGVAA